jgi:hypothetical protein
VKLTQSLARDVGVYLRGTDVCVPEQQLHSPQVRTMVNKMGREGVSQGMGRQMLQDLRPARVLAHNFPETLAGH